MTTRFQTIEIALLEVHENNPRRKAVADAELVESIKSAGILQPLVVAPIDNPLVKNPKPGMGVTLQRYRVLAGHRRLSGAKKAHLKQVPCVVREDLVTEGQQVEAMLIENAHREDLTPIEEAEGFAQLQLFGYKQKDIAKATGRDPKTVSSRLRLLKLAKSTKDRVHKGQMTLDDALAIAAFADDPETTKQLEHAASSSSDWTLKHQIDLAKKKRKHAQEQATTIADLKTRGIPEIAIGPDQDIDDVLPGGCGIYQTSLRSPAEHDGCLRWEAGEPTYYSEGITYYCATPTAHYGQLSDAERQRREDQEAAKAAREKAQAEAAAAETVRAATIMDTLGLGGFSAQLRDLIRGLLPGAVADLSGTGRSVYQAAMNIDPADRWNDVYGYQRDTAQGRMQATKLADHLADLDRLSDTTIARALVALLLAHAEDNLQDPAHGRSDTLAIRYLDLLEQLGHEPCPVDAELRADIAGTEAEAS